MIREHVEWDSVLPELGETNRELHIRVEKADAIPIIEIPLGGGGIVEHFYKMSSMRRSGISGIERLSPSDIIDYVTLTGTRMTKEEVSIIMDMDAAYCDEMEQFSERYRPRDN